MANNILSKLSKKHPSHHHSSSEGAELVAVVMGLTLLATPPILSGVGIHRLVQSNEPKKEVIKTLGENSPEIMFKYLQNNPKLIEDFLGNYEGKKFLQDKLFPRGKIGNLVSILDVVYGKETRDLYKIDNEEHNRIKEDIKQIVSCENTAYFVKNNEVFAKKRGEEIKKILEEKSPRLNPVYGSDCCIISTKNGRFLISADTNKTEFNEISKLIKTLNSGDSDDSFKNKIFYEDESLYYHSNANLICTAKHHNVSQIKGKVNDYMLYDVDKDKNKELVVSISNNKGNYIQIYKEDKLISSIPCKKKVKNFMYSPKKNYLFLDMDFDDKVYDSLRIARFNSVKKDLESNLQ